MKLMQRNLQLDEIGRPHPKKEKDMLIFQTAFTVEMKYINWEWCEYWKCKMKGLLVLLMFLFSYYFVPVFLCVQINRSPSFGTDEKLDFDIKSALIEDTFRLLNIK